MIRLISEDELRQMRKEVDERRDKFPPPAGRDYWDVNRIVASLERAFGLVRLGSWCWNPADSYPKRPRGDGPPPPPPKGCAHKFVHIETIYRGAKTSQVVAFYGANKFYAKEYVRIDRFFCEKCLEPQEKRVECLTDRPPEWWKPKGAP